MHFDCMHQKLQAIAKVCGLLKCLFWVNFSLKLLLTGFTCEENVPDKLCGEYLIECLKKHDPQNAFWYFLLS